LNRRPSPPSSHCYMAVIKLSHPQCDWPGASAPGLLLSRPRGTFRGAGVYVVGPGNPSVPLLSCDWPGVCAPGLSLPASDKPPRLQKHHLVLGFRPTSLLLAMGRREAGTARCAQERLHAGGAFATPTETDAQKI
jgi:hypothetical protein